MVISGQEKHWYVMCLFENGGRTHYPEYILRVLPGRNNGQDFFKGVIREAEMGDKVRSIEELEKNHASKEEPEQIGKKSPKT
jgi:hypothetical protein